MIAVRLEGRLGNQLFQYAFAFAAAQKLRTGFYLDKSIEPFIPVKYFDLQTDFITPADQSVFAIHGFKNFFSFKLKKAFYALLQNTLLGKNTITIGNNETPANALQKVKNRCLYYGYFQSQSYFINAVAQLKQQLVIKKKFIADYNNITGNLSSGQKKIVIHIRRGDYLDHNLSLPLSYYKTALNQAGYADKLCVFVSDDPAFISEHFAYITHKYVSNHTEIIDLQFLTNADVCILSGSSFSWWGAWLNNNPGKLVYAPKNWLGFESKTDYPVGIADGMDFNWIDV